MKTLEEIISMVPEGYGWLLRNDDEKGYLANITTSEFVNDPALCAPETDHFYTYANTPQEALEKSVTRAISSRRARMV